MASSPLPACISGHVPPFQQVFLPGTHRFSLTDRAVYTWRKTGTVYRLVVPSGFDHNFASVPRPLWALISPLDLGIASVFHDWLYATSGRVSTCIWTHEGWVQTRTRWTREQADRLFGRLMREQDVARWRYLSAVAAVRALGWRAWEHARAQDPGVSCEGLA